MSTNLPFITATIRQYKASQDYNEWELKFLVDTGANISIINSEELTKSKEKFLTQDIEEVVAKHASNEVAARFNKKLFCNLCIKNQEVEITNVEFYIADQLQFSGIIGTDVLQNFQLDLRAKEPLFLNNYAIIDTHDEDEISIIDYQASSYDNLSRGLICNKDTYVYPTKEKWIDAKTFPVQGESLRLITNGHLIEEGLDVQNTFFGPNFIQAKIINNTDRTLLITKGTLLSFEETSELQNHFSLNTLIARQELDESEREELDKEFEAWKLEREKLTQEIPMTKEIEKITNAVDRQHRKPLNRVLTENDFHYCRHSNDVGFTKHYIADIELLSDKPVFMRPYPIETAMIPKFETKVKGMIKGDILTDNIVSEYNSPCLFVAKSNGRHRLVQNYSAAKRGEKSLNQQIRLPRFPNANIRRLLQRISDKLALFSEKFPRSKVVFSTIDLSNAFHNLLLRKEARRYTSFIFNDNQYSFKRLPQGLASSPMIFAAFIYRVFKNTSTQNFEILSYQDDVIIVAPEEHVIAALDVLFQRVRMHNLILNIAKCKFFKSSIEFLGYVITPNGFSPSEKKIQALLTRKAPKTFKALQAYAGSFNYYQRNFPNLSILLAPITDAISKGEKRYKLTPEITNAIEKIQETIKEGGFISHLNYSNDNDNFIYIATDASLTACAGVIGNVRKTGSTFTDFSNCGFTSKNSSNKKCCFRHALANSSQLRILYHTSPT
ncbi:Oidioi.mRNA.OKI2018_I69.chr1.g1708.t1.cds [Oikopleura dioica]|uniref:ribonuclease H n=1 Tax=Oikopleura dioica TaxID=34765 RepID=A0ABN7SNR7_OIKDI|nr:Oidioi.mRNA.OKI2018_I69.chr1.g1708.t1.cds [Oikopleura dioica]